MIRLATVNDKNDIIRLLHLFKEESGYESRTDLSKFNKTLDYMIADDNSLVIVALDDDFVVVGFLLATVAISIFCNDVVANELAWFMDPKHRKTKKSLQLLNAFEYWGKEVKQADFVTMSSIEYIRNLGKFYNRMGYELVETVYRKRVS